MSILLRQSPPLRFDRTSMSLMERLRRSARWADRPTLAIFALVTPPAASAICFAMPSVPPRDSTMLANNASSFANPDGGTFNTAVPKSLAAVEVKRKASKSAYKAARSPCLPATNDGRSRSALSAARGGRSIMFGA